MLRDLVTMKLFGRSRARATGDEPVCDAHERAPCAQSARGLSVGQYVTDGARLFCVAHVIRERRNGAELLELEDCRTLELVVCPADETERTPMAPVRPVPVG